MERLRLDFEAVRAALWSHPDRAGPALSTFVARHGESLPGASALAVLGGTAQFQQGEYTTADTALRALLTESAMPAWVRAEARAVLGCVALERGDYDDAASLLTEVAAAAEALGDDRLSARAHNNLGLVAWRTGDLTGARKHYHRALALFGDEVPPLAEANLRNNLGLICHAAGDVDGAITDFEAALGAARAAGATVIAANALANLADVAEGRGDGAAAWRWNAEALALRREVGHARGVVGSQVALGRLALARGDTATAADYAGLALGGARAMGLRKHEADALAVQAKIAEEAGEFRAALALERAAGQARDRLHSTQVAERVAELEARFHARESRLAAERAARENARLQEAMQQVAAASEARGAFLAMMSHEMRTPLAAILGAAELLELKLDAPPQRRLTSVILRSANSLLATISDVLDLSRIDAGEVEVRHAPCDVRAVFRDVATIVETDRERRGLSLVFETDASVPVNGVADAARIRQIVLNLVANALKFTEIGGVHVRATLDEGACLVVQVSDTGIGIPPEARSRLFEPFFQADRGTTRRWGGSGLGLAISKRLAEALGGTLALAETSPTGTTFVLRLPFAAAVSAATPTTAPTVLLVDDDDAVRSVLAELLHAVGAHCTAVGSGREAIATAQAERFDLLLIDLNMPELDGLAVASALRDLPARRVAISGALEAYPPTALAAAGFAEAIAKPVTMRQLRALLAPTTEVTDAATG
jgi:signal transduction histidine kinase/ActR/RegA family two-component response regulator